MFDASEDAGILEDDYGIPRRYLRSVMSPWAAKRLKEFGGDISQFRVVKLYPSILDQIAIAKTEPGDENNQDISALVGKVDIRKLEEFEQNDPDAYSYSGALCKANQGLMEFVEMFKAPIKVLHPLLTATQEGNYNGTEAIGGIPFDGVVLAHSNEAEWQNFKSNKNNEAFIDRVYIVKVPYCLRVSEEVKIYEKLIKGSSLSKAPCAPDTMRMLAQFSVLSRLKEPENSNLFSKMRVYDGENLKDTDPKAKTMQEYHDAAGVDEGMQGQSTRFAFKILSKVFNFDASEVAANPVHLMYVLEQQIDQQQFPGRHAQSLPGFHQGIPRAEVHRVHRQGNPDGVSRVVLRIRPEHLRPLRDLRGLLDSGSGVPRSRNRRHPQSVVAQRRTREDREAGRHFQSEGLPQRDRQLRVARAREQQRPESVVARLREAADGHREEDVLEYRGSAAGDFLQCEGIEGRAEETQRLRRADGRSRLHRKAGAIACRVVSAGAESPMTGGAIAVSYVIDRRLNSRNKNAVNRQRFMQRYKTHIQKAVQEAIKQRSITDMERGEDVAIPASDVDEPSFRPRQWRPAFDRASRQQGVHRRRPRTAPLGWRRRWRQQLRRIAAKATTTSCSS